MKPQRLQPKASRSSKLMAGDFGIWKKSNCCSQILAAKRANPAVDTRALEAEIDRLVYGLYGLTEDKVKLVEGIA